MGTISDKLTYLNETKGKIKDAINLTNANILSEDTFRSYAEKLKLGLVDIINNGTDDLYDGFPKTTQTGTEIALNNTYEAPMEIGLNGNTHQDSYTGKNLNIYPYAIQGRDNGITFTINEDGTVILNGQNNNNGNSSKQFYYNSSNPRILEAGTYYIIPPSNNAISYVMYDGTNYYDFNANNNYSITFNVQKEIQQFYVQVSKGNTTTFTNEKIYPMLSTTPVTVDDYEPYVGGIPSPNPEYPQDIEVVTGNNTIHISNSDNTISQEYPLNLGSIELCKIGDYQDKIYKSNGKWYLHKEFKKYYLKDFNFNTEANSGNYRLVYQTPLTDLKKPSSNFDLPIVLCSHYTAKAANNTWDNVQGISMSQANRIYIYDKNYNTSSSASAYNTWLQNNNPYIIWQLSTPTITEITDDNLIEQLNALKNAKSVNDKTYISQINEQVPFILDVSALSKN